VYGLVKASPGTISRLFATPRQQLSRPEF
jgi:hypothetical protein